MVSSRPIFLSCVFFVLLSTLAGAALPAVKGDKVVFEISPAVVVKSPPRFGVNVDPPAMSHWNTEPWHNQWWLAPNPNAITARHKGTATGGSETTLEDEGKDGKGMKIGFFDVFRDGFFDGGTAVVYRMADGKATLLREGKIALYQASASGPNRLTFSEPGPAVRAGDEYVLTTVRMDFPTGITRTWGANPWWLLSGYALDQGKERELYGKGVQLALSPDVPPGGGSASLALTVPASAAGEQVSVGTWLLSGQESDWPRFHEGKTYVVRLWLKQQNMPTGAVKVHVASLGDAEFHVTSEWKEYSLEVVGAPPPRINAERFDIGCSEPGTLFLDNVTIVEKDRPSAYGFYPNVIDALKRFQPSSLRLWALQENHGFGKALDDALGDPEVSNMTFRETGGASTTAPLGLHRLLVLCQQVGADPWIICSTMFSAAEYKKLVEYLAGPADSPYGKKRAAWGQEKPWTEVFGRIKIEIGNETWNPGFMPQGFPFAGARYGAYAEFLFQQMKASPWYRPEKFQLVINGWIAQTKDDSQSFGASALHSAPSAQAVDIAYYTGGWDSVGLMKANDEDESWMNILTFSRRMLISRAHEFKATVDAIAAEQGRAGQVQSLVYEAGPGYTLPGPGKFNLKEQAEGKSLAQAINSLDIFMSNLRDGYGDQEFFTFKNGHYWASHNRQWGEHIAWKALGMRNTLLTGDLITAKPLSMVTMDLPATEADVVSQTNSADTKVKNFPPVPDLPLVDCYPFQDGKRHSFMLISRRLDGSTPVTLELPYEPESAYAIHTLGGDSPGLHNIDEEVVKVVSESKQGMTKSFSFNLPAHAVVVVVNEAK